MAKIRTFIAVYASQKINSNVARLIERFGAFSREVNWIPEDNLHLTLNFVGEINDREVPEFCSDAAEFISQFEPFDLVLGGLDGFPSLENPKTIWIGAEEGGDEMALISREITKFLRDWSLGKSRFEFAPHMTIGRVKKGTNFPPELATLLHRHRNHDAGSCHIDRVKICSSTFEGGRPQYASMATIELEG
ncbi:RNA 2',3'-cyclic phosphodiesterase [Mariniblastus fucicola]|uniref:RNA 2',3'-cyclic phosphodiesterase n=1 Tax=Mariniblastus fucicola TaxID=980251 RepID=A0A5B9PF56_9BACT|nr:RNA 2',3'-cyclic phosphodiesterase [Mariniblastus fucicola]QEG23810.1 2',5' RNA ligase family [Mariniblastus fucicola]